ncbi:GFA family protein [Vibrio alfacsensis]|uniref:GFA family protein n=1 Tax=Vibrio alfacsensis TaxID=1074311 RepID=UPI002ADE2CA9|nr:GFA family protein [Vibrio alfacsensis]WQE77962.1 GFA family protein [Vibrio alfacsensis]
MTKITHTCDCVCGLVQIRCTEEPINTSICHCFDCQKRTGSVFGVQARFHKDWVILDGDVIRYSRINDTGGQIQYEFCPACGTTMRLVLSDFPEDVVIPMGLFHGQEFPEPTISIYESKKHGWMSFDCTMKHIR